MNSIAVDHDGVDSRTSTTLPPSVATTRQMAEIIGHHAGRDVETVMEDIDRDRFMTPAEAVEYGLIDAILPPPVPDDGQ